MCLLYVLPNEYLYTQKEQSIQSRKSKNKQPQNQKPCQKNEVGTCNKVPWKAREDEAERSIHNV